MVIGGQLDSVDEIGDLSMPLTDIIFAALAAIVGVTASLAFYAAWRYLRRHTGAKNRQLGADF